MDKIEISDRDVSSLENVAPGVTGLRVLFVNLYGVVTNTNHWVLVDAGLPYSEGRIRRWIETLFGAEKAPAAIVLTHGHFDHVGAIEDLLEHWKVPVYAHEREMRYLTGAAQYPPPDPSVGGGLMALLSRFYPRGPIDISRYVRPLPEDGRVPELPDWRWVHTPGHTEGHISLWREDDRTLIVGDAFCTTKQESFLAVATQRPELHGPPAYYTPDWEAARYSVERLAALRPEALAPGHGLPMSGTEVAGKVAELALHFDEVARPESGKYVEESGVMSRR